MRRLLRLLFLIALLFSIPLLSIPAHAAIPRLINYQGKLTTPAGAPVADGSYQVTFRILDAENAGNMLWEEVQSVTAQKGVFSVLLGGVTELNIPFDKPYWLEIKVGSEVMSPRQQIASAGYAISAENLTMPSQQGDIIYYDGTRWVRLPAGTAGQMLHTRGAGANPQWASPKPQVGFGNWVTKSSGAVYQAETDGFVVAENHAIGDVGVTGYTDSSNPPTTIRCLNSDRGNSANMRYASISMPVKKGDYWKVDNGSGGFGGDIAVYWISIGN